MFVGILLVLVSFSHRYSLQVNLFELVGAFAHFGAVFYFLLTLVSVYFRNWLLSAFALVASLHAAVLVYPAFEQTPLTDKKTNLTVVQANLWPLNATPADAIVALKEADADVISFQESNTAWKESIEKHIKPNYPFVVEESHNNCCYGIALYSKYPIVDFEVVDIESVPSVFAEIVLEKRIINVCSFHALAPVAPNETSERNMQLEILYEKLSQIEGASVVMGDFNIVTWDPTFTKFVESSDHKRLGCGLQPTFPMDFNTPMIPIDHILYSDELTPTNCGTIDIPGSDHLGVVASFSITE